MRYWILYDPSGRIRQQGSGPDFVDPPTQDGLTTMEVDHRVDTKTSIVVDGVLMENVTSLRTLNVAKDEKRAELLTAWMISMKSGVTVGAGKVAPTDSDSLVDYLMIKLMAADGDWVDTPIKLLDGSFELLTPAKAQALWSAIKTARRTLVAKLRDKFQLVQAATTIAQVDAITWD